MLSPLTFAAFLLLAPFTPAQELEPPRKNTERGRLILPERGGQESDAEPAKPEQPPAPAEPSFWGTPQNRYEEAFQAFEALPDPVTERQYRASLQQLQGLGLGSRTTALKALESPQTRTVRLAARLLEDVGEPSDAITLIDRASGAGVAEVVAACLESSLRLNGGWLPARAIRLLEHPRKPVRSAVESRLSRLEHESHVVPLLQKVRYGRDTDTRQRAARLLTKLTHYPDVRPALRGAINDPNPGVAFAAAGGLAGVGTQDDVAFLEREILATEAGPELGYLLWAFLGIQQQTEDLLIREELESRLLSGLGETDMFVSGVSAACLAEYGFRSDRDDGLEYLNTEVPHALVRAVSGVTFYPQYSRLVPLAEKSLERITGQDFSDRNPSAWLEWQVENHRDFQAVRAALRVAVEDRPRLYLGWRNGSEAQWRHLGGIAQDSRSQGVRLLGDRALADLIAALEEARVLDVRLLPGTYGDIAEPMNFELELQIGTRRKRLAFHGDSGTPWVPALAEQLERIFGETTWQILAGPPSGREFVMRHLPRWDRAPMENRRALMVELSRGRIAGLSDAELLQWSATLSAEPGLEEFWNDELAYEFLDEIALRLETDEKAAIAALQASLYVADPALTAPMLTALSELEEPARSDLLVIGLERLGPEVCAACLGDERLAVRVNAARALGRIGADGRDALVSALSDSNPLVVRMVVRSLGELKDPSTLGELLPLAEPGQPKEVRREALWALGQIGSPAALELVRTGAEDVDPAVRIAAIQALGELPGAETDLAFRDLFPRFADTPLEAPYLRALETRGAGTARDVLRPHLDAPSPVVMRQAALHLGALGDPLAAPTLIAILPRHPHDQDLLAALAFSLCVDFRSTPDPAGVYAAWWRDNGRKDPTHWLARSIVHLGLPIPDGFGTPEPPPLAETVPALLNLLQTGPAFLRPAITYHLNVLTGVDAPALRIRTPVPMVRQVAQVWQEWLDARAEG